MTNFRYYLLFSRADGWKFGMKQLFDVAQASLALKCVYVNHKITELVNSRMKHRGKNSN